MKLLAVNNINYYSFEEINNTYPKLFTGCKTKKDFLDKHNISANNYIHARLLNKKLSITEGKSRKFDKLFIRASWFNKKFPDDDVDDYKDNTEDAPEIIELKDIEKFTDNDDNIVDIEVRGIREVDGCYFKVRDIMIGFGIKSLHNTIIRERGYCIDIHYKYFNLTKTSTDGKGKIKKLFLTYTGLLRILFASHKKTTDKFINWASNVLFTAQMGTKTQKQILAANVLGIDAETVKEVFKKSATSLPCIYLLHIGTVADLKKPLCIDNDVNENDFVIKCGMTDDLKRRLGEHQTTYSKIKGSKLELLCFNYIDTQFMSKAETELKKYFKDTNMKLEIEKHDELAIVSKKKLISVKKQFVLVGNAYMGHAKDLIIKLKDKDHEIEILHKDHELLIEKHKNELLIRDLEIANMKLQKKK